MTGAISTALILGTIPGQRAIVRWRHRTNDQKATVSTHYPPLNCRRSFIIAIGEVL